MKLYVAICSLSLLSGAALGHFNGQYSAASRFVDDCEQLSFVVFHDKEAALDRRFHCFEIVVPSESPPKTPAKASTPAWVI
ncbi:MAG: hypothetical protein AAGA91_19195 [Pseudomonadota bacterium]